MRKIIKWSCFAIFSSS